jgi:hypothetical protein
LNVKRRPKKRNVPRSSSEPNPVYFGPLFWERSPQISGGIVMDQDVQRRRRRAEWHIVLGAIALIGVGWVGWKIVKVVTAPSTEEAMRLSLAELNVSELSTAYTLHPDTCAITKLFWKWSVACEDVPIYLYRDLRRCDPGPPRTSACHTTGRSTSTESRRIRSAIGRATHPLEINAGSIVHLPPNARRWPSAASRPISLRFAS